MKYLVTHDRIRKYDVNRNELLPKWELQASHTRTQVKGYGHNDNRKYKGGPSQTNKALLSSALVSDKKPVVKSM